MERTKQPEPSRSRQRHRGLRFERLETLLRLALELRANAEGLTLAEIERTYGVSRRTAERMRDAIDRVFPELEQVNPGEMPKRWRIKPGTIDRLIAVSSDDLVAVQTAARVLRDQALVDQAQRLELLSIRLRSLIRAELARKIAPDLEALAEAEGTARRPGPREAVSPEIVEALRHAIIACRQVELHYRSRGAGKLSRQPVRPYGLLYGNRHYLVARNVNEQVDDVRLFTLSGIEKVEPTEIVFERDVGFSLNAYADQSFGVFQEDAHKVVWRFTPDAAGDARHYLFHPTQTFEDQPDGSLVVRFRAGGLREMCWHLFTWGDHVEILQPDELRRLYHRLLREAQTKAAHPISKRRTPDR